MCRRNGVGDGEKNTLRKRRLQPNALGVGGRDAFHPRHSAETSIFSKKNWSTLILAPLHALIEPMPDPQLKYQQWYTSDHNVINAMQCPDLIGSIHNMGSASSVIGKVKKNLQSYALAYPISGVGPRSNTPSTSPHPYYQGTDYTVSANSFVKMGTCNSESVPACRGKGRYVYVRNIPKGGGFYNLTKCNIKGVTEGRGLLPGVLEDIGDILDVGKAFGSEEGSVGSYKCKLVTQPVGANINDDAAKCDLTNPDPDQLYNCLYKQGKTWWMEQQCSPQAAVYENYSNPPTKTSRTPRKWASLVVAGSLVLALVVLAVYLVYSVRATGPKRGSRAFKNMAYAGKAWS